jgi:hypothetical protein
VNYEIAVDDAWIRCLICGMISYNQQDVEQRYCGNCHRFLAEGQQEEWLENFISHLKQIQPHARTPLDLAQLIHEALQIAEAEKYATPESRFTFTFEDASEHDLDEIRQHLTPFENGIVQLERKL